MNDITDKILIKHVVETFKILRAEADAIKFDAVVSLIKMKEYRIAGVKFPDSPNSEEQTTLAITSPKYRKIFININEMGTKNVEGNLSKYMLLHEYYHILEEKFAPLMAVKTGFKKKYEKADRFASLIFKLFNEEVPSEHE